MKKPDKFFSLKSYLDILGKEVLEVVNYTERAVKHITNNSKKVNDCSLFVAIKGSEADGHNYISDAIKKNAGIVFHETKTGSKRKKCTYVRGKKHLLCLLGYLRKIF